VAPRLGPLGGGIAEGALTAGDGAGMGPTAALTGGSGAPPVALVTGEGTAAGDDAGAPRDTVPEPAVAGGDEAEDAGLSPGRLPPRDARSLRPRLDLEDWSSRFISAR